MRLYNGVKYLILIFLFFLSCRKKEDSRYVLDLSPKGNAELTHITRLGSDYYIVGGEKFFGSKMYRLNSLGLTEVVLPTTETGNILHNITSYKGHLMAVGDNAAIYYSFDSGKNWQFRREALWYEYTGVSFCGDDSVMLSGRNTLRSGVNVLCSAEGYHLRGPDNEQPFTLEDVQYLHSGIAYTCGYGALMKTMNGGLTWQFTLAKNDFFKAMYWKNEMEGVVVGYQGSIQRTIDGGEHFTTFRSTNNPFIKHEHWLGIHGHNATLVCVGERGAMMYSQDDGQNWTALKPFTTEDLRGVYVIGDSECLVSGTGGSLFKVQW